MIKTENTDILIVGQGLAGTLLSYHLYKKNIRHKIIDQVIEGSASRVAAGLINPIAVKWVTKTWQADLFQPYADTIFRELEDKLQTRFYYPQPIFKIYGEGDPDFWKHRLIKGDLENYINIHPKASLPDGIIHPYQFGEIKNCARIDMAKMLDAYRNFISDKGDLIETQFNDDDLENNENSVSWKQFKAKSIIFCRGSFDAQSKWFKHLMWNNTKGEFLDVEIKELDLKNIVSKEVFVMPMGEERYKIGATYSHAWDNLMPTPAKTQELLDKWHRISDLPLTIHKQVTGVRPTFNDRRPVLEFTSKNIGLFNGLGSRGGLMAPYLAKEMVMLINLRQ